MNAGLPGCHGPGDVWVAHDEIVIKKAVVDELRVQAAKATRTYYEVKAELHEHEVWRNVCWYLDIQAIRDDLVAKGRRQMGEGETLSERHAYIRQLNHKLMVIHELVIFATTDLELTREKLR